MIGVIGWYSANICNTLGMVSIGTKPELMQGRAIARIENEPAPSGLLAIIPKYTDIQDKVRMYKEIISNAAHQPSKSASGRKPIRNATRRISRAVTIFLNKGFPYMYRLKWKETFNRHGAEALHDSAFISEQTDNRRGSGTLSEALQNDSWNNEIHIACFTRLHGAANYISNSSMVSIGAMMTR
mgnify:CR=1 FL=1